MKSGKLILIPAAGIALVSALCAWTAIASAQTAPTTEAATAITSSDATLNAMNGDTAATDSSFWVSTSTFSTASPTMPAGVYSTADLGAQAASSSFSAQLSSAAGLTVTPSTIYYVAAWTSTDGGATWTPGAELNFSTLSATPTAPTITAISPTSGSTAGGTSVMVTGTGLNGATAVDFGTTPGTITATTSDTSLTVTSPAESAGTVDVTATTPNGTSATSSADQFTYNLPATTTEPVISNIAVSDIGTSTATISWNTDVNSDGTVNYGTTTPYTMSASDSATSTMSHSVTLTSLLDNTLYHFDVQSTTAAASSTTATSSDMQFSTASSSLAIDNITSVQSSGVADNTFADGWQWDVNFSIPVTQNAFRIRFSDWGNASSSFPTANDVQIWSPQSSNASSSSSAILETDNGYSGWLYFPNGTNDIDLYVQVKIPFGTANGSYSSNFTAETYPSSATSTAI